jgi:sec-independent protein translocase protein TatA
LTGSVIKENFEMAGLGVPELLIILAVVLLVFGVGRISRIGSELGKGISAFREGVRDGQKEDEEKKDIQA